MALGVVLLIGLSITQIYWVGHAYNAQEQNLDLEIKFSLTSVAQQILEHRNDSSVLIDPVKQVSANYFTVATNDTLHPYYLESLLAAEFKKREIDLDFEFSIYDCFTDSVVFKGFHTEILGAEEPELPQINWDQDGHYFGVFFPGKTENIWTRLKFWVLSSGIVLLVVIFFAYAIWVILKQKRLSEVKTDFINNMTHELKTPISTIGLSSEVLLRPGIEDNPERLRNYAKIIFNENNRLKSQVEKVLQIAALDKERVHLSKKKVDVHSIINELVQSITLSLEGEAILEKDLSATNPEINADEVHITNILYNLIDNALKYSRDERKVSVSTRHERKGICISIEDNGIGISKDDRKLIFDKFYRVPTGNLHDVKGFGLGLHYVKLMVNAHGGRITLTSEPGNGTRFDIYLPQK